MTYWKEKAKNLPPYASSGEGEWPDQGIEYADHLKDRRYSGHRQRRISPPSEGSKKRASFSPALRAWIEEVVMSIWPAPIRVVFLDDGPSVGVYADPLMVVPHLFTFEIEDGTQCEKGENHLKH